MTTLEAAEVPKEPSSPNIKRNTLIGVIAGGVLAVISIIILEILDDRVRRPEDIEDVLGLPILGIVPDIDKL